MKRITRKLEREVETLSGTKLVVTLAPDLLGFQLREKGRRKRYLLPFGAAYVEAIERERAARKGKRRR